MEDLSNDFDLASPLDSDNQVAKMNKIEYSLWEFYEIHPSIPRKIVPYGSWDNVKGLKLPTEKKWFRRQNLEVFSIMIFSRLNFN